MQSKENSNSSKVHVEFACVFISPIYSCINFNFLLTYELPKIIVGFCFSYIA